MCLCVSTVQTVNACLYLQGNIYIYKQLIVISVCSVLLWLFTAQHKINIVHSKSQAYHIKSYHKHEQAKGWYAAFPDPKPRSGLVIF